MQHHETQNKTYNEKTLALAVRTSAFFSKKCTVCIIGHMTSETAWNPHRPSQSNDGYYLFFHLQFLFHHYLQLVSSIEGLWSTFRRREHHSIDNMYIIQLENQVIDRTTVDHLKHMVNIVFDPFVFCWVLILIIHLLDGRNCELFSSIWDPCIYWSVCWTSESAQSNHALPW